MCRCVWACVWAVCEEKNSKSERSRNIGVGAEICSWYRAIGLLNGDPHSPILVIDQPLALFGERRPKVSTADGQRLYAIPNRSCWGSPQSRRWLQNLAQRSRGPGLQISMMCTVLRSCDSRWQLQPLICGYPSSSLLPTTKAFCLLQSVVDPVRLRAQEK